MQNFESSKRRFGRLALLAGFLGAASMSSAFAEATTDAEAMAQESWRETIAHLPVPAEGCFQAEYPNNAWARVECVKAPDKMYLPRGAHVETVGNGHDYAAAVSDLMSAAVGSFPTVTGVTSEKDGSKNIYSIQLNSNFMSGAGQCSGHSGCQSWLQFVYSSGEQSAFMQYWLIGYGSSCPSGWNSFSGDCWKNSAAVAVPKQPITNLSGMKMSGKAVNGGSDTLTFTTPTKAYSTTGADSVCGLATAWKQSEFNIIGDGGGSKAVFNSGSSMTVKIAVTHGTTTAPTCASNAGTTGETNNLNLGSCTATGGASPSIQFTQSN